jgi:hypothetical protein
VATAQPRPGWTPGGSINDLEQWYTEQLRRDPSFRLPEGFEVGEDGAVRQRTRPWAYRNPWIFPVAGVGAGLVGGALAGTGPLAGAGGSAAAGGGGGALSESVIPTATGFGSGATNSVLSTTMRALAGGLPLAGSLLGGQPSLAGGVNAALDAVPGAREALDMRMTQARRVDPIHQALTTMTMNLLPRSARGGQ